MKLYNVIFTYDTYVLADGPEEARETIAAAVKRGEPPTEQVAVETLHEHHVRRSWHEQLPFAAPSVSDEDCLRLGTTLNAWRTLYTKK